MFTKHRREIRYARNTWPDILVGLCLLSGGNNDALCVDVFNTLSSAQLGWCYTVYSIYCIKPCRIEQKQRLLVLGITGPKKKEHNYSIIRMNEN
jgi:hypothetical protein